MSNRLSQPIQMEVRELYLKALERISAGETERVPFILRQVGEFFRLARIRSGLSIETAALHFGLEATDLSAIENGSGGVPLTLIANVHAVESVLAK